MINTELNIEDIIQLSQDELELIKNEAKKDAISKLQSILLEVKETNLQFSFEVICKVTISLKSKK